MITVGDIMSDTMSTPEGNHKYTRGFPEHMGGCLAEWKVIVSSLGAYNDYSEECH